MPDIELYYVEQGPADAGETVLFVHGSLASSRWQPVMSRLPAAWRLIALDQRGQPAAHGDPARTMTRHFIASRAGR